MKWTWDKFGFAEPEGDPHERLQAVLQEVFPEYALQIVGVARDADWMKIAIAVSVPGSLPSDQTKVAAARTKLGLARLDIIPWSNDQATRVASAIQPAKVEQVLLCEMIGRAVVLVPQHEISHAVGAAGRNVRLASKLSGWDIDVMTAEELAEKVTHAISGFAEIKHVSEQLAEALVEQGYLCFDDLSLIEPDALMEMGGLSAEQAEEIIQEAESRSGDGSSGWSERQHHCKVLAEALAPPQSSGHLSDPTFRLEGPCLPTTWLALRLATLTLVPQGPRAPLVGGRLIPMRLRNVRRWGEGSLTGWRQPKLPHKTHVSLSDRMHPAAPRPPVGISHAWIGVVTGRCLTAR